MEIARRSNAQQITRPRFQEPRLPQFEMPSKNRSGVADVTRSIQRMTPIHMFDTVVVRARSHATLHGPCSEYEAETLPYRPCLAALKPAVRGLESWFAGSTDFVFSLLFEFQITGMISWVSLDSFWQLHKCEKSFPELQAER
jgi:hypothetical protein